MTRKKLFAILSTIGTIAGLAAVLLDAKINFEDSDRFHADMDLFNKGLALQDEYDLVWDSYHDGNMTKKEYITKLKELMPKFRQHLDEMDSHLWVEDAISDRKMIADTLEFMKKETQNWEVYLKFNQNK